MPVPKMIFFVICRVLADNLSDTESKEEEKSEAAGLLAQVTSPWIENNSSIEGLSAHLDDLVKSLTSEFTFKNYLCNFKVSLEGIWIKKHQTVDQKYFFIDFEIEDVAFSLP